MLTKNIEAHSGQSTPTIQLRRAHFLVAAPTPNGHNHRVVTIERIKYTVQIVVFDDSIELQPQYVLADIFVLQ